MFVSLFQFGLTSYQDSFGTSFSSGLWGGGLVFLNTPLVIYSAIGIVGVLVFLKILVTITRKYARVPVAFRKETLLLQVPKQSPGKKPGETTSMTLQEVQEAIGSMDSYFDSIAGLRAQRGLKYWLWGRNDHISFEIISHHDQIKFYVIVPKYLSSAVQQHLAATFPYVYIEEETDYNIFAPHCKIQSGGVIFRRDFFFPIKTYDKFEADPLNDLTNVLSKIDNKDGAVIQFVVRSAKGKWHKLGPKVASKMQQGKRFTEAYREARQGILFKLFYEIYLVFVNIFKMLAGSSEDTQKEQYQLSHMEQEMIKGFEEKTSRAGMDVNIRVITSASSEDKAKQYLDMILSSFNQYNIYEYGNSFVSYILGDKSFFIKDIIYRNFDKKKSCLLNTREMAGLFHLPFPSLETPKILWLMAKKAPPPVNIPKEGLILGDNIYRGIRTPIRIKREDRRRHIYTVGQTGSGKSNFLINIAQQDIANGEGLCVIDPHGELCSDIASHVPKERINDVIYFDPSDSERPMALNLLEFRNEQEKTFVVNEMLAIFDKLYDLKATGGPMFEQYMRNALLLIMSDVESGATMMEVSRVLSDDSFRKYKLSKCDNIPVHDFWTKEAEKAGGEASLANMVPYITSKMTPFIANDIMRPIISQQKSAFDFRDVMDSQKILLVDLSKGKIGEMNSNLLGMVVIGKLLLAALSRVDMPMEERKDFYLYIDEFQNFITESIGIILSEARKYRLSLNIAHQFIAQLVKDNDTSVRDAVFGNVGNRLAYRVGVDDAEIIAKQFAPVFNEYDVINTTKYTAYARILIDNESPPAFNLHPYPPTKGDDGIVDACRKLSRLTYGRDRRIVEAEVLERVRKTEKLSEFL